MINKTNGNSEIKTYFGKNPQPFKDSYHLKDQNLKIINNQLIIECTRCHKITKTKRFKIHPDGAITFTFRCINCQLSYDIYRNNFADYLKVYKVLTS